MKYFDVGFEVQRNLGIGCLCSECESALEIKGIDVDCGELITLKVRPCPKCSKPDQIDNESEFFKDLLEYAEEELGQDAVEKLDLFGMTWHKRAKEPK